MSLRTRTRAVLGAVLLLIGTATQGAPMHDLLIGTYTQDGSEGLYRYRFDAGSGRIDSQPVQVVEAHNPSWLVLDATRNRLFAVNENGPGNADPVGRASSFSIDPDSQALTPIDRQSTLSDHPTHASLSHDGRYLLVANYAVAEDPGGSLTVIPVNPDGTLEPVTQIATHQASGVHPERQQSSHVHSVVPSPDGRFVFVSDLGADKVFVYRYDPANTERPLTPAEPAAVTLPPGSGPRHLAFSEDGKQAWLTLELTAQLARFDHADGVLTQRQLVDLIGENDGGKHSAAAVHPSHDGRFLYVSDRGEVNRLLVFAIEPDGTLREIQRRPTDGQEPREFTLSPDGRHVLVANQLSDTVVVIERDAKTGLLGETVQTLPISRPSHVVFMP
ncbi:lactonase family protein [Stutzerimonas urumqiensis]|uniref:lactonase family protein n=1 Tax=Stutzerimonas urumqiensis TaxID=638269 RepID=UPI003DA68EBA